MGRLSPTLRKKKPRVTPGLLVLVVGPSGAGKDSLIAAARRKFRDDPTVVFARRTITRPEAAGEDHLPVSRAAFKRLDEAGSFYLSWTAHGLHYGVPSDVKTALTAGHLVIVNVSRGVVADVVAGWPSTRIIQVTVALDALRTRLESRGRETADDIDKRIKRAGRAKPLPGHLTDVVDNSGRLGTAVRRFNALIARYVADRAKR